MVGVENPQRTKVALAPVEHVLEVGVLDADPRDAFFPVQVPADAFAVVRKLPIVEGLVRCFAVDQGHHDDAGGSICPAPGR